MRRNMSPDKHYRASAQTPSPKLAIFLVDESTSMTERFGQLPKSEVVDLSVNAALHALINLNNTAGGIKDRMYVSVLGYGGDDRNSPEVYRLFERQADDFTQDEPFLPLSAIQAMSKEVVDGRKAFVRSRPDGWTPMAMAVKVAGTVIHDWVRWRLAIRGNADGTENPRFPLPAPVIINVTDGLPSDDDAEWGPIDKWVTQLQRGACYPEVSSGRPISLIDGPPLLLNVGVPTNSGNLPTLVLPTESELPRDSSDESAGVRRLWRLASPLHPNLLRTAIAKGVLPSGSSHEGRRLYANAGASATILDKIFDFGTYDQPF